MIETEILKNLPYSNPFLFVDSIDSVSNTSITGRYTFKESEYFYKGHFKNLPITPGVILTECMAQIGLVCFGLYLTKDKTDISALIALTETNIEFLKPVYPKETVIVVSNKIYFRFNKLKCNVKMLDTNNTILCKGSISGVLKTNT